MLLLWRHQWSKNFTDSSALHLFLFTCPLWNPPHWVPMDVLIHLYSSKWWGWQSGASNLEWTTGRSTLKQVTLEWKGCSWPKALSWHLFNCGEDHTLNLSKILLRMEQAPEFLCWAFMSPDFMVYEEPSLFQTGLVRGTKRFLMKIISFIQITLSILPTFVCLCGTVLERNGSWSLVLGKKSNENSDIYIFIQTSASLCYQVKVSKGFKTNRY